MIAKNTAASLIGQLRTKSCPMLTAIVDEPADEGFIDRAVPLGRADHLLDDDPVAIYHPALGHARRLVVALDRPRGIVQDLEREAQLPRERPDHRIALLVDAHRHHPESVAAEASVQPLHRGHLHATGQAPRRPHVEQHDLAAIVRERRRTARPQVGGVEPGSRGANAEEVDLRADLDDQRGAEDQRHDDTDRDAPATRLGHTVTTHRRRRSRPSRAGWALASSAWPATNVSAPAACAAAIVWDVIPPSTSRNAREPCAASISRARRILSSDAGR